jgi:hypothetical protein
MDQELLRIFSEELRETRKMASETKRLADAAMKQANASWSKAESAWEMVIMTRNQIQEDLRKVKLPWWRRFLDAA